MAMKDQLEHLVAELLVKGVRYEDAQREFEKRFITQALQKTDGQSGQDRRPAGHAPQYPEPEDRRIPPAPRA